MNRYILLILVSTAFLSMSYIHRPELNAQQIVERSERSMNRENVVAELSVQLIRPKWTKTYELKSWSKGQNLAMAYIMSPEKDKGTVFLKTEDEVLNYIPRINKVVKMPMNLLSQKWMGSDMTMDDLVKGSSLSTDYKAEIIGEGYVADRNCYKLKLIPVDETKTLWSKVELWVDKGHYLQMKMLFYDEDEEVTHSISGKGIKKYKDYYFVSVYEVIPANGKGKKTRIEYISLDFGQNLSPSFFSRENMKILRP